MQRFAWMAWGLAAVAFGCEQKEGEPAHARSIVHEKVNPASAPAHFERSFDYVGGRVHEVGATDGWDAGGLIVVDAALVAIDAAFPAIDAGAVGDASDAQTEADASSRDEEMDAGATAQREEQAP